MNLVVLPPWRRTVARRFAVTLVAMLPALVMQAWQLDAEWLIRLAVLASAALAFTPVITPALLFTPSPPSLAMGERVGVSGAFPGTAPTHHPQPPDSTDHRTPVSRWHWKSSGSAVLLDALTQATLLAALWPSGSALWPAIAGLIAALLMQRLFGGWSSNPFPPSMLALAVGLMLASGSPVAGTSWSPSETAPVALAWLASGIVLALLRLRPWRPMLCFSLPLALFLVGPDISANYWISAAIGTTFIASDRLHLPPHPLGQCLVAALAGLGTAAIWLAGAPAPALAFAWLLATFLSPWIEQRTLPRPPATISET